MNARRRPDHRPVPDRHMSAHYCRVRQDHMIAHLSVVRDMDLHHQQIVIADRGYHSSSRGSTMNIDKLSDLIAVADPRFAALATILQILRRDADGRVWKKDVVHADHQRTFQK